MQFMTCWSLPTDWARPTMFHPLSHWRCFCGSSVGHSHFHKLKIISQGHFGYFTWIHEVLMCLHKLGKHNITLRDRFWPYFKDAIGAIDGSHIAVVVPVDETISHTCRHGNTSQNVLAICDWHEVYLCGCWLARFCTWFTDPHSCIGKLSFISCAI